MKKIVSTRILLLLVLMGCGDEELTAPNVSFDELSPVSISGRNECADTSASYKAVLTDADPLSCTSKFGTVSFSETDTLRSSDLPTSSGSKVSDGCKAEFEVEPFPACQISVVSRCERSDLESIAVSKLRYTAANEINIISRANIKKDGEITGCTFKYRLTKISP